MRLEIVTTLGILLLVFLAIALAFACTDSPPSTGRAEIELEAAYEAKLERDGQVDQGLSIDASQEPGQRRGRGLAAVGAHPAPEFDPDVKPTIAFGVCCQHDGTSWIKLVGGNRAECSNGYFTTAADPESVSCDLGACIVAASRGTAGFVTCYDEVLASWCVGRGGRGVNQRAEFFGNTWCEDLGKNGVIVD